MNESYKKKTISVCMASYNGEKYISQQVASILSQLLPNDELIISDDGSTDTTKEIISSFNDSRIKMIDGPQQGFIKNFEHVLAQAKGDYIILSDQDDIWLDGRVAMVRSELSKSDLVLCDVEVVNTEGGLIFPSFWSLNGSRKGFLANLLNNSYIGCAMAFKREVLARSLPFPLAIPIHDWWIGLVAESCFTTSVVKTPFIQYRRHDLNVSQTTSKSKNSILKKLLMRARLLFYIGLRKFACNG